MVVRVGGVYIGGWGGRKVQAHVMNELTRERERVNSDVGC